VGVFNTTLSKEYYILFRHFGLTKQELYELAAGAANCIFNTQSQKDKLKERFEDWKAGEKDLK
jgi:adenosine deaminase